MPWIAAFLGQLFLGTAKTVAISIAIIFVVFTSMWLFGYDFFIYIINEIFSFVGQIMRENSSDPTDFDFFRYISQLSPVTTNLLGYLGFNYCIKILMSALTTRTILNLIPMVRL